MCKRRKNMLRGQKAVNFENMLRGHTLTVPAYSLISEGSKV
jgi:hypothetical protein